MTVSTSHLVILPSYNTGPRLVEVVSEVLRHWRPVLVVVDGSTDRSEQPVLELAKGEPALAVLVLPGNTGKGAAVLAGTQAALARRFTHALVMDADGQHPAASIAGFMAASHAEPGALVLGRPVFPANIPAERLHGRKLSVGLVRLELLGGGVADPLFGFRVYPLAPLLAVLGPRRGGRRYDFDTEAAVRLGWAGVPLRNLAAPVRYYSRAEGGVSHFHYVRDNAALVWLHLRLIAELVVWRWPAALRRGRNSGLALLGLLLWFSTGLMAGTDDLTDPGHRLTPGAPAWIDLVDAFGHHPDASADFTERRYFTFKKEPVELKGEVRVSATHGLSLHYKSPEERTVIFDQRGVLIRADTGERSPPADPRAAGVNEALWHVLRFDFAALARDFDLFGQREGVRWTLALVPRTEPLRHALVRITVAGEAAAVRQIELRRTEKQFIEIMMESPRESAVFTAEELKRFFR